jgi:hypothetical protein
VVTATKAEPAHRPTRRGAYGRVTIVPSGAPRSRWSGSSAPAPMNAGDTAVMQQRRPVGGGPSGQPCPRWPPYRAQTTAVCTMP